MMQISEEDFWPPTHEAEENIRNDTVSMKDTPPGKQESFRRRPSFTDEEYPEWLDDLPPWRNPDPGGDTYLYVWQQHRARIRGHH